MSYKDPTIQECIPSIFLVNPNIWHMKVPLVVYATMEMHESDRVLWQFGFRQSVLVEPQKLDDLHPIDLRRRTNENWLIFHAKYINMSSKMGPSSAPTQEPSPMAAPPPGQYVSSYSTYYTSMPSTFPMMTVPMMMYSPSTIWALTESPAVMPSMHGTQYSYTLTSMVPQTPPRSLFYVPKPRPQPTPKVEPRRNLTHNRRPP
ncbi:hypothetical protein Gotur_029619 [Gossypium turneri]